MSVSPKSARAQLTSPSAAHAEPIEAEIEQVDDGGDTSAVGRIRALLGMLTRFIGVKDFSNLCVLHTVSHLLIHSLYSFDADAYRCPPVG